VDLRVGITRSKLMDEAVGRVPSVHVESEEATILATRVAVEALQSHFVMKTALLRLRKASMSYPVGKKPKESM
jgi:hypothetical protein